MNVDIVRSQRFDCRTNLASALTHSLFAVDLIRFVKCKMKDHIDSYRLDIGLLQCGGKRKHRKVVTSIDEQRVGRARFDLPK